MPRYVGRYCPRCGLMLYEAKRDPGHVCCKNGHDWDWDYVPIGFGTTTVEQFKSWGE